MGCLGSLNTTQDFKAKEERARDSTRKKITIRFVRKENNFTSKYFSIYFDLLVLDRRVDVRNNFFPKIESKHWHSCTGSGGHHPWGCPRAVGMEAHWELIEDCWLHGQAQILT